MRYILSWLINFDGFVKSPSAALRFIFHHADVLSPQDLRVLHLELFTVPYD
jgi:hypothetical protein